MANYAALISWNTHKTLERANSMAALPLSFTAGRGSF